jgi:hypothetical protein
MTGALRGVAGWFVEPADGTAPPSRRHGAPHDVRDPGRRLAALGSLTTAPVLAATVAMAERAAAGAAAALVLLWRPPGLEGLPPGPTAPGLPAAHRLAARLARRDLPAVARGRLVWLALPADCDAGLRALRHAEAAAGEVPAVLAVARPREPGVDAALAERDLIVVAAEPGSALAVAALDDVVDLRVPACACAPPPPGAARLAALTGLHARRVDVPWPPQPAEPDVVALRRRVEPRPGEELW